MASQFEFGEPAAATPEVPPPPPPSAPAAWYAPAVRAQYEVSPGVVATVRGDLEPRLAALEGSRVADGVAYRVRYNGSAARSRAARCPSGPGRTFGPCEVHGGVVVQERAGETTVIAVAFDLTVEHRRGTTHLTVVVDPV